MYVWEHRNRRHRGLAYKPSRPRANATAFLTREDNEHEIQLHQEEVQRQELEDVEIVIKQEEVRRLIMDYLDDDGGKKELSEVTENLKHWKENCAALGYDSDGETLSLATPADSLDASTEYRAKERKKEERAERSRGKKAREVFDMFDADGSHTISTSEMKELLAEMCIPVDKPQLKALMKEIDTDRSGEVDFEEFYRWYRDNASVARNAEKTQTVGLFATKLIKGLTGFTLRMEAMRIIVAHAQAQVEKRERERFRTYRPPRLVCDGCGLAFASAKRQKKHLARRDLHHEASMAAESEANRRFHPVSVLLDHTTPLICDGATPEPHRAIDVSTARKKRLRRLVFSDRFFVLYGGLVSGSSDDLVEEKRWINRPHPRLEDPEDRRGDQLRRGQAVEGENPTDGRAKVPLEVTHGGLAPNWGGVRRGRQSRRVAGRQVTGLQHILLRLNQEKEQASNVFTADDSFARAKVVFRWDGWSSQQVTLHTVFNKFKGEEMGEDQRLGHPGHEVAMFLSPGTYKYYFMVDDRRRVDESLPVVGDDDAGWYNVVTVTNKNLGQQGELAAAEGGDGTTTPPRIRRLRREFTIPFPLLDGDSSAPSYDTARTLQGDAHRASAQGDHFFSSPPANAGFDGVGKEEAAAGTKDRVARANSREVDESDAQLQLTVGDELANLEDPPLHEFSGELAETVSPGEEDAIVEDEPNLAPLIKINLSWHEISDDGAAALSLALRDNVRVEELDLSLNRISGNGTAALASTLAHPRCGITRLRLAHNGIGRRGGDHLGRMLGAPVGGLEGKQRTSVPCLKELNLADNVLGEDGVEALSAGLIGHPCLEILILNGNDIGHDGTKSLCEALLRNTSLKTLSLRRNSLLADAAQVLSGLLVRNGAIVKLDLAYNPLGPEGIRRLSPFMYSNTTLETLVLCGCIVQPPGVKSGVYSLARGLTANRAITSINLSANELDEYAGQELAHVLLQNKTITEMDLSCNRIPDEWLREHHTVCSEVYDILPSLAESLRLNRDWRASDSFLSPRSVQREKVKVQEMRASERRDRQQRRRQERRARSRENRHQEVGNRSNPRKQGKCEGSEESTVEPKSYFPQKVQARTGNMDEGEGRCAQEMMKPGDNGESIVPFPENEGRAVKETGTERVNDYTIGFDVQRRRRKLPRREPGQLLTVIDRTGNTSSKGMTRRRADDGGTLESSRRSTKRLKMKTLDQLELQDSSSLCSSSLVTRASSATTAGGISRNPGVWTRRGIWIPEYVLTGEAADRARVEGRKLGDRQRRRREDQEVNRAGAAKRDELTDFMSTPEGNTFVRNVSKLLLHARKEEEREKRVAERTCRTELRQMQKKQRRLYRTQQALENNRSLRFSVMWAHAALSTTAPLLPSPSNAVDTPDLQTHATLAAGAAVEGPPAVMPWDVASVASHATAASASSLSSSLPSAAAAATMEAEGEEEANRMLGRLREEKLAWEAANRPRFLEIFSRFDPQGIGEIPAAESKEETTVTPLRTSEQVAELLLQLQLPEYLQPDEVQAITKTLVKETQSAKQDEARAAARTARRAGLQRVPDAPRPFTNGGEGKRVTMLALWRWHRKTHCYQPTGRRTASRREARKLASELKKRAKSGELSQGWARRVILAVGEREARLQATERFRGVNTPRYVCPECHEYGCSTLESLDDHLLDTAWHAVHAALQDTFEENADLVAVATRALGGDSFPDYFGVARMMAEETEIPVYQEATELSRPLGTIKYDMLVLALGEEGDWLKINFESHKGVYARHTTSGNSPTTSFSSTGANRLSRRVLTRMRLPTARVSAKAAASTAFLSSTTASSPPIMRPINLAASGMNTFARTTSSALHTATIFLHGHSRTHEPEPLASGTATFKPRVVRFIHPVVYCHAQGLPSGAMLKVRADPGGARDDDPAEGCRVLGRLSADQCIMGLATSGDWLQVRYGTYEAAWMLLHYRGRRMLTPLADLHPGVTQTAGEENGKTTRTSPFPMPPGAVKRDETGYATKAAA